MKDPTYLALTLPFTRGVNASETLINVGKSGLLFSDITQGVRRICKGTSGEHKIIYHIMCTPVPVTDPLTGHLRAKTTTKNSSTILTS